MKKRIIASALALAAALSVTQIMTGVNSLAAVEPKYMTPAFPAAEGSAAYIGGARGGQSEVYHVTNLNDDGEGSFRDAVSKGNRIIVFDVSGMIDLKSRVSIAHNNITIMGHTAPGDGICFRGNSVKINGENIILRYLRFRPGSKLADGSDTETQDGFSIPIGARNIILDHCSVSWGTDENLSIIGGENVTVQRCIISEALNSSIHAKGEHSYAGIWGGRCISIHHNIIASHKSRNPKIGTSETVSMTPGYTDKDTIVDMWNNVIYNWGDKAGYGAENGANVNIVNNYYKPGPATPAEKRSRIFELSPGNKYQPKWSGDIYASGNFIDDDGEDAAAVNEDNWQVERGTGVYLASPDITYNKLEQRPYAPLENIQTAQEAYEDVLSDVGASLPKQDLVDARIIDNVKNRTAPATGTHGSSYLVDDPVDGIPEGQENLYDDRGYPIWVNETHAADFDADRDGIADSWEDKMGLDKTNPNDSLNLGAGGYTWLEIYGESLISDNTSNTEISVQNNGGSEYTLSVSDARAVKAAFYVDDAPYSDDLLLEVGQLTGAEYGDTVIVAGYENDVLKELKTEVYSDSFIMPEVSGDRKRVFVWDSLEGMKPTGMGGSASYTGDIASGMHMVSAKLTYADGSYKITPAKLITVKGEETQPQAVSGDFEIVGAIYDIPNFVKNVYSGIYADDFVIAAGYNDEFKPVIRYGKKSNSALSEKDNKGYKYVKITVKNGHADLYAASTIGLWDKLSENGYDYKGSDPTAGKYTVNPDNKEYEAGVSYEIITDFTEPQFTVDNIDDDSVIGFNDTVEVSTSENSVRAVVLFNNEIIATSDSAKVEKPDNVIKYSIPVAFSDAKEGTLTVMCYNDKYQSASKSYRAYVSADASPWQVTDISAVGNQNRAYMYATEDYTFKMGGMDGNIGGTADECGYVYQSFNEDNRIYYRSRMQDAKQFGIMLRKSLDPDSEAYFFGGEKTAEGIEYTIKSRNAKGGDMTSETIADLSGDTVYIIAEKNGNDLNIYKINDKNTISDNKTLIKTIDVSALDSVYYMGFASVTDVTGKIPDCGWIGLDNRGDSSNAWIFDNGLDWHWQIQERNVLKPVWTDEEIQGSGTGKMLIAPDDNYTGERYIFHEYFMEDGYLPEMRTDIMLTGEEPAMNVYLQTGDANTAYKLTFDSDNKIKNADGVEIGTWEKERWYSVLLNVDIDTQKLETVCTANVSAHDTEEHEGEVVDTVIPADSNFRAQNNIQEKTPVTKAVYFEPIASANGKYYIDGVGITPCQGEYKIVTGDEKLYKFDSAESYAGAVLGGVEPNVSKSKKISGIEFKGAVRLGKRTTTMTFPVTGSCDIVVYAASASSDARRIVINDGKETDMTFGSAAEQTYRYRGKARDIVIYGKENVDVYGIKVITKELVPVQ